MKQNTKKKKGKMIISSRALMINSAGKLGRHLLAVQSGTGTQESKKNYNRKKEKASLLKQQEEDAFSLNLA